MLDFKEIYRRQAVEYDQLVSAEDYEGNILRALQRIRPLAGLDVIELGAGTGRLTNLLAALVNQICYFDSSTHMLSVATMKMARNGHRNCRVATADNRAIPAGNESADVVIAGWSLGHLTGWFPTSWRSEIGYALSEMKRILRPGGTAIILETLGTGRTSPRPPNQFLAAYYQWLEEANGFESFWIRTDYRFESVDEACRRVAFFFGTEFAETTAQLGSAVIPECTGIWWLTN